MKCRDIKGINPGDKVKIYFKHSTEFGEPLETTFVDFECYENRIVIKGEGQPREERLHIRDIASIKKKPIRGYTHYRQ